MDARVMRGMSRRAGLSFSNVLRPIPFQDSQLLPQREIFQSQLSSILEPGFQKWNQQEHCFDHGSVACPLLTVTSMFSMRTGFWQRTGEELH